MTKNDIASAILQVCNARRGRGATTTSILGYLNRLKTETHVKDPEMVEFIDKVIKMEVKDER